MVTLIFILIIPIFIFQIANIVQVSGAIFLKKLDDAPKLQYRTDFTKLEQTIREFGDIREQNRKSKLNTKIKITNEDIDNLSDNAQTPAEFTKALTRVLEKTPKNITKRNQRKTTVNNLVELYNILYTQLILVSAYKMNTKFSEVDSETWEILSTIKIGLFALKYNSCESGRGLDSSSLQSRYSDILNDNKQVVDFVEKYDLKNMIVIENKENTVKAISTVYKEVREKHTDKEKLSIHMHNIKEKCGLLNNTISASMLEQSQGLSDLFNITDDTSSHIEIIRQLRTISGFLDTQIEANVLPGSKAYINRELSKSSLYIKSVIENDNWVENKL